MSERTSISEDDILPPISITDPLLKDEYTHLIQFHEKTNQLKELYRTLVGEDHFFDLKCSLHRNYSLSAVAIPPFTEPYDDPILFLMATIFSFGRQLGQSENETCRRVCAIGEMLASEIDAKRAIPGIAKFLLMSTVRKLLSHPKMSMVTALNMNDITKARKHGGLLTEFNDIEGWPRKFPSNENKTFISQNGDCTMTPKLAMTLLKLMAMHPAESLKNEVIMLITHTQLALANLDDENPGFMCEVGDYLVRECNDNMVEDLIAALRDTYLEHTNARIAFRVFDTWSKIFPGGNTRIMREFKEFIREKIICLFAIKKAFLSFPDFFWKQLCAIPVYGEELFHVVDAMKTQQAVPFCGFEKKNYPNINPERFPNFAATCRDILIRCKGYAYLQSYSDFQSIPAHEGDVTEMIEYFCARKKAPKRKQKLKEEVASALMELKSIILSNKRS